MTRRTTLELCEELGLAAGGGNITEQHLRQASEIFLTTTAGGIIPVTSIGGQPVGDGQAGPKTVLVHKSYWSRRTAGWLGEAVKYGS
jgi:branched-chain amino acid aminotransferase